MTGAGSGGQGPPDGTDAEEAERCPICLGVLAGGDLAMPDSCCHVFCLRCLLTWAELQMVPSCPVDRKPFTNVYKWDLAQGCVQVPVRRRAASQTEAEQCCCRKPQQKVSVKSKQGRRVRRQKVERTPDSKTKGLVRKCSDDDPSSLSSKKVRGTECCASSPSPFGSLIATSTQDIAESHWVAEDAHYDTMFKHCKPQRQDCPWLSTAAPIPANGTSRQSFHPYNWNHSPFPFGLSSSPFTSSTSFGPGHFAFQGVVCAVTCSKGGEKRGTRASGSKAPTKEAESLPSRRSERNSKAHEEAPASGPSSPQQSSSSDSESSTGQSTKPGKAAQVPTKRKGKQVTNRKASGKRKATARKKPSPKVVSVPGTSEEEDEEGSDKMDKEEEEDNIEKEQQVDTLEQQESDAEGSLKADQDGSADSADEEGSAEGSPEPLCNDVRQDGEETQEHSDHHEQGQTGEEEEEREHDQTSPSSSTPNSPVSCSEGQQNTAEEEQPSSPVSCGEEDSETKNTSSPVDSQNMLLGDHPSPYSEDQDDKMEICAGSQEANNEDSSKEVKTESCESSTQPGSSSAGEPVETLAAPEGKAPADTDTKELGSQDPSTDVRSEEGAKDDGPLPDDTSVVPMECSSPSSEHGDNPILEEPKESSASAAPDHPDSESQVTTDASIKDHRDSERNQERKNGRQRRSRFHSPTSTWSPKRESRRDQSRRSRSWSRERDGSPPSSRSSRARSRERDRDRDRDSERDYSRRERSRDRRRRRSRSHSRSKSRSRSRSRTRSYRRGPSPERSASREQSPQRNDRRAGWRSGQGSGSGGDAWRYGGSGRIENGVPSESSPDRQGRSENPDWVMESIRNDAESRNRDVGSSRWEDHRGSGGSRGDSWGRGGRGGSERGRGGGRGGGNRSFYNQQEETGDNRWQPRNNFSGTSNNSGNDAYSRFNENRPGGRRKDSESGDSVLDRSGWSSASSWAVRRTLPADVQDYYSKRERGGGPGGWSRPEEEQPAAAAADPSKNEPTPQAVPGNAPVPMMSVLPPHPPQLNVVHHYSMQGPRGALPVTLQPAAPYAMPPQGPVHLHPAVPLLQVPAVGAQGLPPPPPPPPPMQQGSQTAAAQPDGHTTQMANTMMGYGKPPLLPTPTKAGVAVMTQGATTASQVLPSSTTQHSQHSRAQADSSKKEKKQQIQEKAINEVKTAIKPYYQKKEITKEEYKEIVRKAVEKVCHSKSGEVNSSKVANLVKAYVDKYKHARKK